MVAADVFLECIVIRVVFNQKGGVGKSSITCNLAAVSASLGNRTLVVDLDVQGNSSHYLGFDDVETSDATVAHYLSQRSGFFNSGRKPVDFVHETPFENLFVMPASPELAHVEKDLESRYKIYKLRDALQDLEAEFDHIFIDTPPNFNFYSKSALIAANELLIPFDCDSFSLHALHILMDNVFELKEDHNPNLELGGVVVNQYNSQARLPQQLVEVLHGDQLPVYASFLPASVKMKESHCARKPLIHLAASHKLTKALESLFGDVEGRNYAESEVAGESGEVEPA